MKPHIDNVETYATGLTPCPTHGPHLWPDHCTACDTWHTTINARRATHRAPLLARDYTHPVAA